MPTRTEGLPDVYVFQHKATKTFIVQIATGRAAPVWREFTAHQIPNTNCLAMSREDDLERLFSFCDDAGLRLILHPQINH